MRPRLPLVAAWVVWTALAGCGASALRPEAGAAQAPDGRAAPAPGAADSASPEPADGPTDVRAERAASLDDAPPAVGDAGSEDAARPAALDAGTVDGARRDDGSDDGGLPIVVAPHAYRALALAVGLSHTCVLLEDHRIKCWGDGGSGQLGYGDSRSRGNPSDMGDALPTVDLGAGRTARAISAGRYNTCAILDDGSAKCWGNGGINGHPETLGDEPGEMGDALPAMPVPAGRTVARVAAGVSWASAILDDGSAITWQGGTTTTFPPATSPVEQLVHGSETSGTIVLFENGQDGVLNPWGLSARGFGFGEPASFVAGARAGQCDVLASGRAVCSSDNPYSRWNDATMATRIAAGLGFSCLLTKDGRVRCRGGPELGGCEPAFPQNTYWCEGSAAADNSFEVQLGQPAVDVQAGDYFACALLADGGVRCWGGSDVCVPYTRDGVSGYDCLEPATPFSALGGGVALVTVANQTRYGPWRAVDLGTRR
jgi:hypothetical protein